MNKNYTLTLLIVLASAYYAHCQTIVPNGDFETWQNVGTSNEEPTSWNGNKTGTGFSNLGPQTCFRESSNPHTGIYCLKLENGSFFGTSVNATATTGQIHAPTTNPLEGFISTVTSLADFNAPFTGRPDSLVGWFKFTQGASDIGRVSAYLHDNYDYEEPDQGGSASNLIASAVYDVPSGNTTNWTRFSVPFSYVTGSMGNSTPTHILLIATASNIAGSASSSTILWVDDLEAIYCTPSTSTLNVIECNSYTSPSGNVWTVSNTYLDTISNVANCDSIITINITINSVSDLTTSTAGITITANNTSATYQWLDCNNNNSEIISETGQSFTATANGNYAVELTENGCVDTTACLTINTVGILENSFGNELIIYPNPTHGNFSINLGTLYEFSEVSITDISGKLIDSRTINQSEILDLFIDAPKGIYIVSVQAGDKKAVIRLIKE
jgi:hypothetical protein